MPTTRRDNPAELLRLAITGLDAQIAELQETRAQLATLIDQPPMDSAMIVAEPRKRRKLSAAARAKISAAAKERWDKEREAKTKAQKPTTGPKKAESKGKPAKARPTPAEAKKGKSKSSTSAPEAKKRKAAR